MNGHPDRGAVVVMLQPDGSYRQVGTLDAPPATGQMSGVASEFGQRSGSYSGKSCSSGQLSADFPHAQHAAILARGDSVPVFDPHEVARTHPERWAALVNLCWPENWQLQQQFRVCEKTCRKWRSGKHGCRGHHVVTAVRAQPEIAPRILFAAE